MSLAGVTSWDQGGTASEIGLSEILQPLALSQPVLLRLLLINIESISYDTVILGKEYLGESLTGSLLVLLVISTHHKLLVRQFRAIHLRPFGIFSIGFVYWRKRRAKPRKNNSITLRALKVFQLKAATTAAFYIATHFISTNET